MQLQGETRARNQARVIIGIFAYNKESMIERIISPLSSVASEIVVCDDASTDSTAKVARTLNAQVITQPHRLGVGAGMRSLFLAANQSRADVLVIIPTDSLADTASISKLVNSVVKHEADIVIGSRTPLRQVELSDTHDNSLLTVYGLPVHDLRSPFRAYSKVAIATITSRSAETDILPQARKLGLGIMEYEISTGTLEKVSVRSGTSRPIGPADKLIEFVAIRHPIALFGGAATIALIAAIAKSFLMYEAFKQGAGLPDFDVISSAALFLAWIMLTVATAVLYALSRNVE
ncbi:MAG: glycosyltransferase [Nitrososphaerales archaeon]